jgi:hypothetical protein
MGILMENELLLLDAVQGKGVLRSLQFPADVSEPGALPQYLWDAGLHSAWVMPATTLSRTATCSWLEQASNRWGVVVHPDPHEPTRPIHALFRPRERNQREARRLALAFPEYAGWGWELTDARSLLATVSYLHQVLARSMTDPPRPAGTRAAQRPRTRCCRLATRFRPGRPVRLIRRRRNARPAQGVRARRGVDAPPDGHGTAATLCA